MSVTNPAHATRITGHPSAARYVATGLAAGIAVLYVGLFLVLLPHLHETDNPAPVFLALAVLYAVGAVLTVWRRSPRLDLLGVGVQVFLMAGYAWIFVGSAQEGDDSFFWDNLAFAVVILAAQVVLGVLLVALARSGFSSRDEGRSPLGQ